MERPSITECGALFYEQLDDHVRVFADRQYRAACAFINLNRNPTTGLYSDAFDTREQQPVSMGSIAATGVGLVALAVAHLEGWDREAADKAVHTLENLLRGVAPRDEATGFFYHFHHVQSGEVWPGSEVSTIDTAIAVAGARIASHHIGKDVPLLRKLAEQLTRSIRWEAAFGDLNGGIIFMTVENGRASAPTHPFNEYAIVASVAKYAAAHENPPGRAHAFWEHVFAPTNAHQWPTTRHGTIPVVTDNADNRPLSSFVIQFPFYLIPEYATSPDYKQVVTNACRADRYSWLTEQVAPSYIWGHGAGPNDGIDQLPIPGEQPPPSSTGYTVDAIGRSSGVASAYIIAGFLPVNPAGIFDLYAWQHIHGVHPDPARLHRFYSPFGSAWHPRKITIIDYSTMLYGLTAFRRGMHFFSGE